MGILFTFAGYFSIMNMNKILLYVLLTLALFVGSLPLCAGKDKAKVKFAYDVDFETYFDNRELYRSNFSTSMSIFGARLTPYVGFEVKQKNMSHSVMAGIDVQKDFGASPISGKYAAGAPDEQKKTQSNLALFGEITMYYRLRAQAKDNDIEMYAGIFPRRFCSEEYGRAFISDSLRFYDNNLEGVLLKVTRPKAAFEIGADWCGKIGKARREKFLIFAAGHGYVLPWLNMGYAVSGEHLASSEEVWGVVDNILCNAWMKFEFDKMLPLDKFSLRLGWLQSFQQDRRMTHKYIFPGGGEVKFNIQKWGVGVENDLYVGTDLLPYYNCVDGGGFKYGERLYFSDPFYRVWDDGRTGIGTYDRLAVYYNPRICRGVDIKLSAVFHFNGKYSGCQQIVGINVNLQEILHRKH